MTSATPQRFLEAFRAAYDARLAAEPKLLDRYKGSDWTRVMLGDIHEQGVLSAAARIYAETGSTTATGIVGRVDSESADRHLLIIGNKMQDGVLRWRSSAWEGGRFEPPSILA
jgi:hypothetical protein